jgi:DNA-binding transcriptional LysR family regulator
MLDVRWLEDLLAIAETRNLTRAAELRHVSQSGLSRRLRSLEHWAGATLLDRRKSPVELTEAGQQLLAVSQDVLGRLNATRRALREDQNTRTRSIRFAAPHILSVTFFPKWLPQIQKALGATRLTILSDNVPGCCESFNDGTVDFVVCFMDSANKLMSAPAHPLSIGTCQSLTIGRERLVPVSAPGADARPAHDLSLERRRSVSYLGYSSECSLGWAVDQRLAGDETLPQLNRIYENSLADGLRSMALSGLGVAWLPLGTTNQDILRGHLVRTGAPDLDIDLDIRIYRPQRRLSRRAEELWATLEAKPAVVELPELQAIIPKRIAGQGASLGGADGRRVFDG